MAYFTPTTLRQHVNTRRLQNGKIRENLLRKAMTDSVKLTAFLSHSHADLVALGDDMIDLVKQLLGDLDIEIYVDANDPTMSSVTSGNTANSLKQKIQTCDIFILAATKNAIESKWVPWELGFADGEKGINKIIILPIADESGQWNGSEYLQIYRQLRRSDAGTAAVYPAGTHQGTTYKSWAESQKRL